MELAGNSCSEPAVAFLKQLRANHSAPLIVIWDNGPAHGGDAVRAYHYSGVIRVGERG